MSRARFTALAETDPYCDSLLQNHARGTDDDEKIKNVFQRFLYDSKTIAGVSCKVFN